MLRHRIASWSGLLFRQSRKMRSVELPTLQPRLGLHCCCGDFLSRVKPSPNVNDWISCVLWHELQDEHNEQWRLSLMKTNRRARLDQLEILELKRTDFHPVMRACACVNRELHRGRKTHLCSDCKKIKIGTLVQLLQQGPICSEQTEDLISGP